VKAIGKRKAEGALLLHEVGVHAPLIQRKVCRCQASRGGKNSNKMLAQWRFIVY
jgi:hypothetical protein